VDVLDGARDLAELAVVDPGRPAPLVPPVGREGEARPIRGEARQRARLARSELAVNLPRLEPSLDQAWNRLLFLV
jgi:hypothetical protein